MSEDPVKYVRRPREFPTTPEEKDKYIKSLEQRVQRLHDIIERKREIIAERDAVIDQRNKMCSDYYEGHVTNMKRIAKLEGQVVNLTTRPIQIGGFND